MTVENLATENVVTTGSDTSLQEIARTMESEGVGSVVVTEDGEPTGIVTDRDIALAVGRGDDLGSQSASDTIGGDTATVRASAEGYEATKKLGESQVRRLPVVDDDGELVGIVTLDDVVATVGEELDQIADVIEQQSPAYDPSDE